VKKRVKDTIHKALLTIQICTSYCIRTRIGCPWHHHHRHCHLNRSHVGSHSRSSQLWPLNHFAILSGSLRTRGSIKTKVSRSKDRSMPLLSLWRVSSSGCLPRDSLFVWQNNTVTIAYFIHWRVTTTWWLYQKNKDTHHNIRRLSQVSQKIILQISLQATQKCTTVPVWWRHTCKLIMRNCPPEIW